jgi:hypothetical protein
MIKTLKKKAELARVCAARLEMEVKLLELTEGMDRIKKEIAIQTAKETELMAELEKTGD